jgi:CBS domain-containing protein
MDKELPSVPAAMKLSALANLVTQGNSALSRRQGSLIMDEQNRLVGIITRGDMVRGLRESHAAELTVAEAGSTDLAVTFADEPLHIALTKMLNRDVGRLPVVEPDDQTRVVGYLGRAAILSARLKLHEEENIRQRG